MDHRDLISWIDHALYVRLKALSIDGILQKDVK